MPVMNSVNSFKVKREAHNLSRTSTGAKWNPFRHVDWSRNPRKAGTWDNSRTLEEQPDQEGRDGLTASRSEPTPKAPRVPQDLSTAETMTTSQEGEDATAGLDRQVTSNSDEGIRNRKKEEDEENSSKPGSGSNALNEKDDANGKGKKPKKDSKFMRRIPHKHPFTVANQIQRTLLNSWINILLLAAPVGIALNYTPSIGREIVFAVNFIAIIPLAALLSFATEEIALRTGETLGGLLNASFGNAVELIVAILALVDGQIVIVQTSLVGSVLSNLLLVLGCCFLAGGFNRPEQNFNHVVAQTSASLLALAVASIIVPTVFNSAANSGSASTSVHNVAQLSRGTAVILLIVYAAYLLFQLKTHHAVFNMESEKVPAKAWHKGHSHEGALKQGISPGALMGPAMPNHTENERVSKMLADPPMLDSDEEEEEEEPQLHFWVAVATLAAATAVIALCAEFMVDSIDAIVDSTPLTEEFVGLILLPIVGNAAEHATSVTVAIKDKMDLAIGVAVGSSMQVALLLIPLVVIIGWGMDEDRMNLSFDTFQVAVMFVAVLLVNYLIGDGKSHWLEGLLLICLWAIIAVCAYFYPDEAQGATLE